MKKKKRFKDLKKILIKKFLQIRRIQKSSHEKERIQRFKKDFHRKKRFSQMITNKDKCE